MCELWWMKHETGSVEFLSSTLDSAHEGAAIFSEYLTNTEFRRGYLDFPPRQRKGQKNCDFVDVLWHTMYQDHPPVCRTREVWWFYFCRKAKHVHDLQTKTCLSLAKSTKKTKNIINIFSGKNYCCKEQENISNILRGDGFAALIHCIVADTITSWQWN